MRTLVITLIAVCVAILVAQYRIVVSAWAPYSDAASAIQNLESNKQYDVLTQHNNNARTGAATHENILSPSSIQDGQFGRRYRAPVSGKIFAQPLYVEQAAVDCHDGKGVHNANITYVATLANIVYAIEFDIQHYNVCWQTNTPLTFYMPTPQSPT